MCEGSQRTTVEVSGMGRLKCHNRYELFVVQLATRRAGYVRTVAANHAVRVVGSQPVGRTSHAKRSTVEHVRVNHRRADVRMAEKLLHGANVIAVLQQMRRKRM